MNDPVIGITHARAGGAACARLVDNDAVVAADALERLIGALRMIEVVRAGPLKKMSERNAAATVTDLPKRAVPGAPA